MKKLLSALVVYMVSQVQIGACTRVIGIEMAKMILDTFLGAEFLGGRHQDRVDMIMAIEENQ